MKNNPISLQVLGICSALAITVGFPPSITATQLFVVPRSIPTTFPIVILLLKSNAFIINNKIGLVLDKKPSNVICNSFLDKDLSEVFNEWDRILTQSELTLNLSQAKE